MTNKLEHKLLEEIYKEKGKNFYKFSEDCFFYYDKEIFIFKGGVDITDELQKLLDIKINGFVGSNYFKHSNVISYLDNGQIDAPMNYQITTVGTLMIKYDSLKNE